MARPRLEPRACRFSAFQKMLLQRLRRGNTAVIYRRCGHSAVINKLLRITHEQNPRLTLGTSDIQGERGLKDSGNAPWVKWHEEDRKICDVWIEVDWNTKLIKLQGRGGTRMRARILAELEQEEAA